MSELKLTDEQAQHAVAYIRHFLERGATIRARGGMPVLQPDGDKWIIGGLHIQGPEKWIKTSERLPTREDADECGDVWVSVARMHYASVDAKTTRHWMPKPRVQPPEPPK